MATHAGLAKENEKQKSLTININILPTYFHWYSFFNSELAHQGKEVAQIYNIANRKQ